MNIASLIFVLFSISAQAAPYDQPIKGIGSAAAGTGVCDSETDQEAVSRAYFDYQLWCDHQKTELRCSSCDEGVPAAPEHIADGIVMDNGCASRVVINGFARGCLGFVWSK